MLVIRVELYPGGRKAGSRLIGLAGIGNVTDLAERSDYLVVLTDTHGEHRAAIVRGHQRGSGFWPLISRATAPENEPIPSSLEATVEAVLGRLLSLPGAESWGEPPATS